MNTTTATLDQLQKDFETKAETARKYREEHEFNGLTDADSTYLKLLIARDEAYIPYKKAKVGEPIFSALHAPVINHRLNRYRDLLTLSEGGIVV